VTTALGGFDFSQYPGVAKALAREAAEQRQWDEYAAQRDRVNDENVRRLREYQSTVDDAHARGVLPPDNKPSMRPLPVEPFHLIERRREWRRQYLEALASYIDVAKPAIAMQLQLVENESRALRDKLDLLNDQARQLGIARAELDMAALRSGIPVPEREPTPMSPPLPLIESTPIIDGQLLGEDTVRHLNAENIRVGRDDDD